MSKTWLLASLLAGLCLPAGCHSKSGPDQQTVVSAEPISVQECAACGMVVREQPSPRGQVVHRDGTREHLCSLSDLLQYIKSPSSHGAVQQVFVELLDPAADPMVRNTDPRPWLLADQAHYVVGVARPGIMGEPVLAYSSAAEAKAAATKHGGKVKSWTELQAMPLTGH